MLKLEANHAGKSPVAQERKGVPEYLTTGGHGGEWEVSKPLERLPLQHLTTGGQGDKWEVPKPLERLPLPPSTTR